MSRVTRELRQLTPGTEFTYRGRPGRLVGLGAAGAEVEVVVPPREFDAETVNGKKHVKIGATKKRERWSECSPVEVEVEDGVVEK